MEDNAGNGQPSELANWPTVAATGNSSGASGRSVAWRSASPLSSLPNSDALRIS